MTSIASFQDIGPAPETVLPRSVYRYVLTTSGVHQLALVALYWLRVFRLIRLACKVLGLLILGAIA